MRGGSFRMGGGLFSIFHRKSASKAQNICDFASFTSQWGGLEPPRPPPPGYATDNKVKRSLVGFGDFVLTTEFQKFFIAPEKWIKKSASKRQQLLNKFLTTPAMLNPLLTSSTNGARHAITPKHGGRKPCQRKRHRTAKTTSYSKTSQC